MDEVEERRKKIREKVARRSSPELFGIVLVILIFAFLLFSSLSSFHGEQGNVASKVTKKTGTPEKSAVTKPAVTTKTNVSGNVLFPKIVLSEPGNTTYTTSLPPLRFRVYGPYLDSVLLSVDGNKNISIPHNSYLADVDSNIAPVLIGNIPGTLKQWTKSGNFSLNYIYNTEFTFLNSSASSPSLGIYLYNGKNNIHFEIYPYDSRYAPSGGFIGQVEKGKWTFTQIKAPVKITYNKPYKVEIYFENGNAKVKINGINWLTYSLQNKSITYNKLVLRAGGASISVNKIAVVKELNNGMHSLAIFANNTLGNSTSKLAYFTVNATPQKTYTIGDTIRAGNLDVTLKKFYGMKQVIITNKLQKNYAGVDIEVKNTGKNELKLKFTPYNPVLVDNLGNTYTYTSVRINNGAYWVPQPEQLKLDVIYPGAIRKGVIFFTPAVNINVKSLTLALYLNGGKYVFEFKRW